MSGIEKTNVMRLLDQAGIAYEAREYEVDEKDLSGSHAADVMGEDTTWSLRPWFLRGSVQAIWSAASPWTRSWT